MEEYAIRDASPADEEAVLDIHGEDFQEFDYLAQYYDYFLAGDNGTSFKRLQKDNIVSFMTLYGLIIGHDRHVQVGML